MEIEIDINLTLKLRSLSFRVCRNFTLNQGDIFSFELRTVGIFQQCKYLQTKVIYILFVIYRQSNSLSFSDIQNLHCVSTILRFKNVNFCFSCRSSCYQHLLHQVNLPNFGSLLYLSVLEHILVVYSQILFNCCPSLC